MAKLNYIKEFNKAIRDINYLSSSNDVSLSNKLILIQQELGDSQFNFDTYETYKFYSNIFNILNQSSDPNSILINGCTDVLLKSTESRNASLIRAMNFVNFLPAIIKLILNNQEVNSEKLAKLLALVKNLIRSSQDELDEHNTKLIIEVLRDCVENAQDELGISKLALNILSDLVMKNQTARHQVIRILKASKLGDKVDKSSDLVGLKFLVVLANEVSSKDFNHIITLSLKSIQEGVDFVDIEPVLHSLDLIEYAKSTRIERNICECEENLKYLEDLCKSLVTSLENNPDSSTIKEDYFNSIFAYFEKLLKIDFNIVSSMEQLVSEAFKCEEFLRSEKALAFLTSYVRHAEVPSRLIQNVLTTFNDDNKITNVEKSAFLKFMQACQNRRLLENDHMTAISIFCSNFIDSYEAINVSEADQDFIFLSIHMLRTLSILSQNSNIFLEKRNDILTHEHIPVVLARALMSKDKEILMNVLSLGSIENYPTEKVAQLLSKSNNSTLINDKSSEEKQREIFNSSSISSKFINRIMGQELNNLINKINEKIDNNEMESLKTSEIISIYRHKDSYFNDHLNALNASLEKYTDLCQEVQHQNSVLRKMCERQELVNWCLEMDKENLQRENSNLIEGQQRLKASVVTFQQKITKENQANLRAQKVLKLKELENEKLYKEREEIELKHQNEKKNLKIAQIENERRIEELKASLEDAKKSKAKEIADAVSEQKKYVQKLSNVEKEYEKLQNVIKINENELTARQNRISQLENELKEAEKIQSSIMSLMQKSKSTLK